MILGGFHLLWHGGGVGTTVGGLCSLEMVARGDYKILL